MSMLTIKKKKNHGRTFEKKFAQNFINTKMTTTSKPH